MPSHNTTLRGAEKEFELFIANRGRFNSLEQKWQCGFFCSEPRSWGYFLAVAEANFIQIIDFGFVGAKDIEKILSHVFRVHIFGVKKCVTKFLT